MISLPTVSLLSIDCARPYVTLESMRRTMLWVDFKDATLVTDTHRHPAIILAAKRVNIQVVHSPQSDKIATVPGIERKFFPDYERAIITDPFLLGLGPVLYLEWDSGVLNPAAWNPHWLTYDFIGAPWPRHRDPGSPLCDGINNAVGNTGFCLRSRKFIELAHEALRQHNGILPLPLDSWLCRTMRGWFESHGTIFAPVEEASRFACEDRIYDGAFGFHGKTTIEINGWGGWFNLMMKDAKRPVASAKGHST